MIGLPLDDASRTNLKSQFAKRKISIVSLVVFFFLLIIFFTSDAFPLFKIFLQPIGDNSICPVHDKIVPKSFVEDNSTVIEILKDESFRLNSVEKLSGAIQVDTQIFDKQPDVPDAPEVWSKFKKFHKYLEKTFPIVFENTQVDYVNTYGLVFYMKGSNPDLKPVLLTAHQDVVPVQQSTLKDWTHPPFSGFYDGEKIYGRGASDCKNVLIAIMESLELLIKNDYKPARGVVAAFGFDEEASGIIGASNIAKFLQDKFGKFSFHSLLDEGPGLTLDVSTNQVVAAPAVGEKGYLDIAVDLTTPGGHSSISPDHTSIGMMGELAYIIEQDPYQPLLTNENPILHYLQCLAVNSENLPKMTRKTILRAGFDKFANAKIVKVLSDNILTKFLIKTSQAIDIIAGGEKANALPENVKMVVNHRVAIESKVSDIQAHFTDRVLILAKKHALQVISFGKEVFNVENPKGTINIDFNSHSLESAPISPSNDTVWKYVAATTRHIFEDLVFTNLTYPIITAPSIMPANTDTRYYWDLTKNIYRYSPFFAADMLKESKVHSVDEQLRFDSHLQLIAFFYEYVQNVDTPDADN